ARERKLRLREPVTIGGARLDEAQGLQALDRGARKNALSGLPERQHARPIRIHHHRRAAVLALDRAAARHLDQNRISHRSLPFADSHIESELNATCVSATDRRFPYERSLVKGSFNPIAPVHTGNNNPTFGKCTDLKPRAGSRKTTPSARRL